MKKILIVLSVLLFLSGAAFAQNGKENFRVSADAEIRVKPDRVTITFGVSERTENLAEGKEKMKKVIGDAVSFCRNNGVKEENIQTDRIYISPQYTVKPVYKKNVREDVEVLQYSLTQTFTVTLEDLSAYDNILYSLLDLGVNKVENINFYSSQMRKYRDEARLAAIKAAQEKAVLLTNAAGLKLGKVVNINEDSSSNAFYSPASNMRMMSQNVMNSYAGQSGEESALAAGMITVKAGVTITYKVK